LFGYVSADRPELKIKEYDTYQAYYCGLCHALKEYSHKARILLNYDCSFLFLLMEAQRDEKPVYMQKHCMVHPLKKKMIAGYGGADYAAAVNILLGVLSMKDHAADDRDLLSGAGAAIYNGDYNKARARYPKTAEVIERQLKLLDEAEQRGEKEIDRAAEPFAELLAGIFEQAAEKGAERPMCSLGYNLGRWIYLIDAYDDFEKDVKKKRYNPFIARFGTEKTDELIECAKYNLNASATKACMAYDLLDIKKHGAILENILYSGIYKKAENILNGRKEQDGSVQRTGR